MSRHVNPLTEGEAKVQLTCDECGKQEWSKLVIIKDHQPDIEYDAVQDSKTWQYADDSLVCSDECAEKFWSWE